MTTTLPSERILMIKMYADNANIDDDTKKYADYTNICQ